MELGLASPNEVSVDEQLANSSHRLRELRLSRGWTLDELSERSGLSKAFLSRLEVGDRRPSLAAILTLARVYDVSVSALFEPPSSEFCVVIRGKEAPRIEGDGLTYISLSNTARFANLQPIRLTISANRVGDETFQHEGEEWVYILTGKVNLKLGEKNYVIGAGDAAHFDSRISHRLTALDGVDAEVIVVACPVPEAVDPSPDRRFKNKRAIR